MRAAVQRQIKEDHHAAAPANHARLSRDVRGPNGNQRLLQVLTAIAGQEHCAMAAEHVKPEEFDGTRAEAGQVEFVEQPGPAFCHGRSRPTAVGF